MTHKRGVAPALTAVLSVGLSLVAGGQAGTITEASIRAHMEFLAGDALQGRGSGTRDEQLAATYIGAQMRRWGLEPLGDNGGFVQEIATTRPTPQTPPVLTVGNATFRTGLDISVAGSNAALSGPLHKFQAGRPVPAGSFVLLPDGTTAAQADTTGAAGVMSVIAPPAPPRAGGPAGGGPPASGPAGGTDPLARALVCGGTAAQAAQAAAASATGAGPARGGRAGGGVPVGAGRGAGAPGPLPWRITLSAKAFAAVNAMNDGVPVSVFADMKAVTWNAIGRLPGSDAALKDEVILLTAHLDHLGVRGIGDDFIYNGADDDASGSTAVLALAEALSRAPRPKRTIIFAWFGSEEAGGFGARHFLDHPPVPLTQIAANLEFEMLGRPDPLVPAQSLWLTGYECSDLGDTLARHGARLVQDPRPEQRFFTRSDNIQLARRGIVAETVSSFNLHADYHRVSDEVRTIYFAHMTRAIQSMYEPVRWLANSSFKPAWKPGMCPLPCGG